jgi:Tetratricopeptide repeat
VTASRPDGNRDVIPRWRDPASTSKQGELGPTLVHPDGSHYLRDYQSLQALETAWQEHGTLSFATDLVGSALVVGSSPLAREAAQFVLEQPRDRISPIAVAIAGRVLDLEPETSDIEVEELVTGELRNEVHELKAQLLQDPRLTLTWSELARHYTIFGQAEKAERAMRIALALSPEHRYILRSAARLAIHNGDFPRAHSIVSRAERTRSDPWLLATEIATAEVAGRRSRLVRRGEQMLESGKFLPLATTELASAIATLELRAGNSRVARRLFERALKTPNENSIAQTEWASHKLTSINIPEEALGESAEARALSHSDDGEWKEALAAAWQWHFDQPFSSGPAELGSYEASLGQRYAEGAELARRGLRANSNEFLLLNNLAFCLINLGELPEARSLIRRVKVDELDADSRATFLATQGLLAFRSGDPETGQSNYAQAIQLLRDRRQRAIATIMLARELLLSHLPEGESLRAEAEALGGKVPHPDVQQWLEHLPTGP